MDLNEHDIKIISEIGMIYIVTVFKWILFI
jgi:hypothetical protein